MATISNLLRLVRRDVLAALKANSGVLALVGASDIHPQQPAGEPTWPFIKLTAPQGLPLRAACVRGAEIDFGVSGFTRGTGDTIAESHAGLIGDAVETCVDGRIADLEGIGRVRYSVADVLLRIDGAEPGAFHWSASIRARVLA